MLCSGHISRLLTTSKSLPWKKKIVWTRKCTSNPVIITFPNPSPCLQTMSFFSTFPSSSSTANQHSPRKNQLLWLDSSLTSTWLTYQLGDGPPLSCQRCTIQMGPRPSAALSGRGGEHTQWRIILVAFSAQKNDLFDVNALDPEQTDVEIWGTSRR